MRFEAVDNPLGEELLAARAPSGLTVLLHPRPAARSSFAAFGTHFGSIDRVDTSDGQPVPMGLAHFLEHKLFEDQQGDVSDRFAALGASTNAMTGFTGTTYIASTVEDPLPCIRLLMGFVQDPWFTDELVAKEQGIIAQEIRMYDDDPDWRVFFAMLEAMYARHPVRDNIAGTVESIAEIDAATLDACYRRFYHPNNLCLSVAGPIEPEALAAAVLADQVPRGEDSRPAHRRAAVDEPAAAVTQRVELQLPVSRPRLLMGLKESTLGGSPLDVARRQLATRLLLDALFGRSSAAFESLYGQGLVDETFGVSYSSENDFGFSTLGGDTDEPDVLAGRLLAVFDRARSEGLDKAALARARNKLLGLNLRALDTAETVAHGVLSAHFRELPPFVGLQLVGDLDEDALLARLDEHVTEDALCVAVLRP